MQVANGDENGYRVKLPAPGYFALQFSAPHQNSGYWYVSLRDSNNTEIWEHCYYASDKPNVTVTTPGLGAGAYYIRVKGYYVDNLVYQITPRYYIAGTSIAKTSAAKNNITVKWTKKSGASKYQVRYSTTSTMKGAKVLNISSKSATKTVENLKAGKKYYVQVRVAKKVKGAFVYSLWSPTKSTITKK